MRKQKIDNIENSRQKKRYSHKYSLLTFVLLICILELSFGVVQNINKSFNFKSKIKGLENKRNEELDRNKQLKSDIANYNSIKSMESIARNSLKMASEDEILIMIKKPAAEDQSEVMVNNFKKKNKK